MADKPLAERIALVTGASRGIGYATALALARAGAHIVAVARTVGGLEEFDDAVRACRRSGTIGLVSTTWEPIPISFLNAQMREVTIVPAFLYGEAHGQGEFVTAATIAAAHHEIAAAVITHRFGLDEATHAFSVAGDRAQGAIKVVLHP